MRYALLILALCQSAYAADPLLVAQIVICESGSRPDVCGDDGISCGIAQFQKKTFYRFAREAGLKHARYMDMTDQITLLHWAIDHNRGRHWTCYQMIVEHRTFPKTYRNKIVQR